jgi:fibronectin type 3 domain-containing protein
MKVFNIMVLAILFFGQQALSQQVPLNNKGFSAKIVGKGKPYQDQISLRWNVDNYQLFAKLAMDGVWIDRLIIGSNNKAEGPWKRVTMDTVKAKPLSAFVNAAKQKDTAQLVIAQLLYGKSTYPATKSLFEKVKVQDEERQNKHLIASIYTAISPAAAFMAGLAFEDKLTVDATKKYVYRIYPAGKSTRVGVLDTGFVYVVGQDLLVKEKYEGLKTGKGDGVIYLQWPKALHLFAGYYIERAEDAKNFKRINKNIYLPMLDTVATNKFLSFTDSVPNYKRFYYRLKGVNAFGEVKTFADTVSGFAIDQTPPQTTNLSFERNGDVVKLKWTANKEKDLRGFFVVQGNGIGNVDSLLNRNILPPSQNSFNLQLNSSFNAAYYRVLLTDTAGNTSYSNPVYVFNPDTIPPAAPIGLRARIDSLGNITLAWPTDQKEPILRGYKVFIANQVDHEFTPISGIVADTTFRFKTTLKTLTKNLFVKIAAVDASFNHSALSAALKIKRPDTIAPQRPVLLAYTNADGKIVINWSEDRSYDFDHYKVYRKLANDTEWTVLQQTRNTKYTDSLIVGGKAYVYSVSTADSSGLYSALALPLYIKTARMSIVETLNLKATLDPTGKKMSLTWTKPKHPVSYYLLYKDFGKGLRMYKSIEQTMNSFEENLAGYDPRNYAIKVIYVDQTESALIKAAL